MGDVRPREPPAEQARAVLLDGARIVEESLVAKIEPATRNPQLAVPGDPGRKHGIEQVHSPVNRLEQVRGRPEAHQVARSGVRGEERYGDVERRVALRGRLVAGQS